MPDRGAVGKWFTTGLKGRRKLRCLAPGSSQANLPTVSKRWPHATTAGGAYNAQLLMRVHSILPGMSREDRVLETVAVDIATNREPSNIK